MQDELGDYDFDLSIRGVLRDHFVKDGVPLEHLDQVIEWFLLEPVMGDYLRVDLPTLAEFEHAPPQTPEEEAADRLLVEEVEQHQAEMQAATERRMAGAAGGLPARDVYKLLFDKFPVGDPAERKEGDVG